MPESPLAMSQKVISLFARFALVAQWIAHQTSDLGVGGSRAVFSVFVFPKQKCSKNCALAGN